MTDNAGPRRYECNPVFQIVTRKICNLVLKLHNPMKICVNDDKLGLPMSKKVQHGISGVTIYDRVSQFFIGLCNFSSRLQIPRVTILNTRLHSYRRGPALSVICSQIKASFPSILFIKTMIFYKETYVSPFPSSIA